MKVISQILFLSGTVLLSCSSFGSERVGDWYVNIPSSVLKAMSESEKTCVERAMRQFNSNSYKASAQEWKRFQTEFMTTASEECSAWASFFYALSLDKAKDIYQALEMYSETMELYPDSLAAGLSHFFRGMAYRKNGNIDKSNDDLKAVVESELCSTHPVAYKAYDILAWDALNNSRFEEALGYWRTLKNLPRGGNRSVWQEAIGHISEFSGVVDPAGECMAIASNEKLKLEDRRKQLREWRQKMWNSVTQPSPVVRAYFKNKYKTSDYGNLKKKYLKNLSVAFSTAAKPVYEKCEGGPWELQMYNFDTVKALAPKNISKVVDQMVSAIGKEKNEAVRSSMASSLIYKLNSASMFKEAKIVLDLVPDPIRRAWLGVEIGWKTNDGKYIIGHLDVIEKSPDEDTVRKAKMNRAQCCRYLLKDYDTAIKIWNEYPNPPTTLWHIAECHRLAGRKPQAQGVLDEICGVFPSAAPSAMLRKGDWYAEDGNKKAAIACYRRILSHADWKKSGESSQAHQRLERYGIATGGAVLNEIH